MVDANNTIQLSHGGGGKEMDHLIKSLFFRAFDNPILRAEEDAAKLHLNGPVAFTTDSFTVSPLFFAASFFFAKSISLAAWSAKAFSYFFPIPLRTNKPFMVFQTSPTVASWISFFCERNS